ncbi:hypothetical protein C7S13_2932 [Burkholderia cepacia]|nr:hypothetical protein [Burkholderia cepacia]
MRRRGGVRAAAPARPGPTTGSFALETRQRRNARASAAPPSRLMFHWKARRDRI